MMTALKILLFIFVSGFISCDSVTRMKFDKSGWSSRNDIEYDYRENMLPDLLENYKIVGIKYAKLLDLLGQPDYKDSVYVSYQINVDYGTIDPVAGKDLVLKMSKDTTIESFKVEEWKH